MRPAGARDLGGENSVLDTSTEAGLCGMSPTPKLAAACGAGVHTALCPCIPTCVHQAHGTHNSPGAPPAAAFNAFGLLALIGMVGRWGIELATSR